MSDPKAGERRGGSPRKEPINAIRVFDKANGDFLGHIQDLTQTGMCLVCDLDNPVVGDSVQVKIQGPGVEPIVATVQMTVRWVKPAEHEGYHLVGFEFDLKQTAANTTAIAKLAVLSCH